VFREFIFKYLFFFTYLTVSKKLIQTQLLDKDLPNPEIMDQIFWKLSTQREARVNKTGHTQSFERTLLKLSSSDSGGSPGPAGAPEAMAEIAAETALETALETVLETTLESTSAQASRLTEIINSDEAKSEEEMDQDGEGVEGDAGSEAEKGAERENEEEVRMRKPKASLSDGVVWSDNVPRKKKSYRGSAKIGVRTRIGSCYS
jgi:hypothetical protein